jgi:hypothetical protein
MVWPVPPRQMPAPGMCDHSFLCFHPRQKQRGHLERRYSVVT